VKNDKHEGVVLETEKWLLNLCPFYGLQVKI
jgi:hypothetical protein